ncbi:hypothetical protein [Williamsia sp.]|uniref:hypothetical protein n=1 Tax=Williamsia sp. TaxID=1872085 RepID=UPI001A2F591D|nr:hypothetical protein [Williamsia sp.]MBJ7291692.1 hypothetical protein [Williamsia sp.]
MTTPNEPASDSTETPHKKTFRDRIPSHLFGGRLRTTTAVLLIAFVGVLMLYGQRADHYKTIDDEKAAASATRTAAPRTTEDTPEYTEPIRTSTRTSSSTAPSTSTTTTSDGTTDPEGGQTSPTTTTTAPGFQLPTIPGIVLPGQTPTTTPVR